ncbi:uncharacterized protein LOC110101163 [Dendrobium catenatum]|uniref:uncharacterized protein LOC110101163 n=1 Tax=Dendrobium catenatum TaxID=906689 RepID=UPI0009F1D7C6|nr:uncharacterized protein LOC110101163 [Dendrobium catenatum]
MTSFMVDNDLHDLGFLGLRYTWSKNKNGSSKIWVRLDRVLMNSEGLRLAPLVTVKHLIRIASGHCPLLLNFTPITHNSRSWLRMLKVLFFWSRNSLKDLGELKLSLEGRIEELQLQESTEDGLSEDHQLELRRETGELNATLARLATWWRQRAKTKWIEEGDSNSHFFHSNASARRRGNRIVEIQNSNGDKIFDQKLI